MKALLQTALCALLCVSVLGTHAQTVIRVSGEGVGTHLVLDDCPTVTYAAEGLVLTAGAVRLVYPSDGTYTFDVVEVSGVGDAVPACPVVSVAGDVLSLANLTPGAAVAAYGVDGRLLADACAGDDGVATLDLSAVCGVVVVALPGQVLKLIR